MGARLSTKWIPPTHSEDVDQNADTVDEATSSEESDSGFTLSDNYYIMAWNNINGVPISGNAANARRARMAQTEDISGRSPIYRSRRNVYVSPTPITSNPLVAATRERRNLYRESEVIEEGAPNPEETPSSSQQRIQLKEKYNEPRKSTVSWHVRFEETNKTAIASIDDNDWKKRLITQLKCKLCYDSQMIVRCSECLNGMCMDCYRKSKENRVTIHKCPFCRSSTRTLETIVLPRF